MLQLILPFQQATNASANWVQFTSHSFIELHFLKENLLLRARN